MQTAPPPPHGFGALPSEAALSVTPNLGTRRTRRRVFGEWLGRRACALVRTGMPSCTFALAFLLFGFCPRVLAILITEEHSIPPTKVGFTLVDPLEFDQFDPSLGILNSVKFTIQATFDSVFSITNTGTSPLTVGLTTQASSRVNLPFGLPLVSLAPFFQTAVNALPPGATQTYSGGGSRTSNAFYTAPSTLDSFVGDGQFSLPEAHAIAITSWRSVPGNSFQLTNWTTNVGFNVKLTYDFTPAITPEPSTAHFGLALAGVTLVRRRCR